MDTASDDLDGHGTHVASTVAGTGAASNDRYRGVAPGAQLVSARVCTAFRCPVSHVLAGMQWVVMEQGARIINVSISDINTPEIDPLEQAVDELTAQYGFFGSSRRPAIRERHRFLERTREAVRGTPLKMPVSISQLDRQGQWTCRLSRSTRPLMMV